MDPKFLTYNDVVLLKSDFQSLEGSNYLNDTVLDFYFSFLSTQYKSDDDDGILPVPTSVSFLLANTLDYEAFKSTIESLNLHRKRLLFFTVNDNSNFSSDSDGGSHWSLLVYCQRRNLFMHFDSLYPANSESAFAIYETMTCYADFEKANLMECLAPRQRNGFDCGLYVMEIARAICEFYFDVDRLRSEDQISEAFDVMQSVDCDYVESEMRSELLQLMSALKEAENRNQP